MIQIKLIERYNGERFAVTITGFATLPIRAPHGQKNNPHKCASTSTFTKFSVLKSGGRLIPLLGVIIGAILTQNTSWKNVEKALGVLKSKKVLTPGNSTT